MTDREQLNLRPVAEKDLELILSWRNSERIRANMYTDHIITREEHRSWFERLEREKQSQSLVYEASGRPLGVVNITRWDKVNATCHWGFYLGETDAPAGSGGRMAFLALNHIFDELGIRKVIGEALAFNEGSISYHKKLGFSQEAHFVKQVLKNGAYQDVISFALFASDWQRLKPQIEQKYFQDRSLP